MSPQEAVGLPLLLESKNLSGQLRGLEYLGGWENPIAAAGVAASSIVTIQPCEQLLILGRAIWTGAVADVLNFRLGTVAGAVDSGANYQSRNAASRGQDTGALGNSDGGIFFGSQDLSATSWGIQYLQAGAIGTDTGGTASRNFFLSISNLNGYPKLATWSVGRTTGLVTKTGMLASGQGAYEITAQAISFQLITRAATAALGGDSGFGIFGRDYVS